MAMPKVTLPSRRVRPVAADRAKWLLGQRSASKRWFRPTTGRLRYAYEGHMRDVLVAVLWVASTGVASAETYSFSVATGSWLRIEQTLIHCQGPKISARVPPSCILSEPAQAYPNHRNDRSSSRVTRAAGHRIAFYPNGTLAECVLADEQWFDDTGFTLLVAGLELCTGRVRFDEDGKPDC